MEGWRGEWVGGQMSGSLSGASSWESPPERRGCRHWLAEGRAAQDAVKTRRQASGDGAQGQGRPGGRQRAAAAGRERPAGVSSLSRG